MGSIDRAQGVSSSASVGGHVLRVNRRRRSAAGRQRSRLCRQRRCRHTWVFRGGWSGSERSFHSPRRRQEASPARQWNAQRVVIRTAVLAQPARQMSQTANAQRRAVRPIRCGHLPRRGANSRGNQPPPQEEFISDNHAQARRRRFCGITKIGQPAKVWRRITVIRLSRHADSRNELSRKVIVARPRRSPVDLHAVQTRSWHGSGGARRGAAALPLDFG